MLCEHMEFILLFFILLHQLLLSFLELFDDLVDVFALGTHTASLAFLALSRQLFCCLVGVIQIMFGYDIISRLVLTGHVEEGFVDGVEVAQVSGECRVEIHYRLSVSY